jgi:hypothetical protein
MKVGIVQRTLLGSEVRCGSCGGHLGDVFEDGKVYLGTVAFDSGRRFCIDGAALSFAAADGSPLLAGDQIPKPATLPSIFDPPKISSKARA